MLARLGPCEAGALFFDPEPRLVVESKDANASPPLALADPLAAGLPSVPAFEGPVLPNGEGPEEA